MPHDSTASSGAFVSLRSRPFRLLWTTGILVFLALLAQQIARGWIAKDLTGSNAGLGGVFLVNGIASLVMAPVGGVLADRVPKRRMIMGAMLLFVVSSLAVATGLAFDVLEYWMLLVAAVVQATAFSLYSPSRMAFTTELVEHVHVANAVALNMMSLEGARVVGPTIAGLLIAAWTFGAEAVYFLASGLVVVAFLLAYRLPTSAPRGGPRRSPLHDMREGVSYVVRHRHLRLLTLASLGVSLFAYPYLVFLPTVAEDVFDVGAGGYGLMATTAAAGAVAMGLVSARWGARNLWTRAVIAGIMFGGSVAALGVAPVYGVALVTLACIGAGAILFQTSTVSLLLMLSDLDYHGRVQSLVTLSVTLFGFAALPIGVLADHIGIRIAFVLIGLIAVAIVSAIAVRGLNDKTLLGSRDLG